MKISNIVGILTILISLFFIVPCWAGDCNVPVVWDYPDPPSDLAKFELRVNGNNATLIQIEPDVLEWFGILSVNDGNNTIDMRACDLSGQCSIWSEPCNWNPVPLPPSIIKCGGVTVDVSVHVYLSE